MYRYILNQKGPKGKLKAPNAGTNVVSNRLGKPRATNALELFGKDKKIEIVKQLDEDAEDRGFSGADGGKRLADYRALRIKLWEAATPDVRAEYEERAKEFNEMIKDGPTLEDIQRW